MAPIQMGIVLCFFLPTVLLTSDVKRPYGRKMCQQFCETADCSEKFKVQDLSCHVVFDKNSSRSRRYEVIWRTKTSRGKVLPCNWSPQSQIQSSVSVLIVSRQTIHEAPIIPDMEECSLGGFKGEVSAVVYSWTFRYVILATRTPSMVIALYRNNMTRKPEILIPKKYTLACMAIDNEIDSVFIGRISGVRRLDLKKKKQSKVVFKYRTYVSSITLDPKKRTIIFASTVGVMFVKYDGSNYITLEEGLKVTSLAFIETTEELYYLTEGEIFTLRSQRIKVISLSTKITSLLSHQNLIIYTTSEQRDRLTILNKTSNKATHKKIKKNLGQIPILSVMRHR